MKYNVFHTLAAIALLFGANAASGAEARYEFSFAETTPLSDGKWVKISINETGVYEISYDQLRKMGFSDPSKVALYGTGGKLLNFNFCDSGGTALYSDSMHATPVLHTQGKIIFYGYGPEFISAAPLGYSNKRFRHRRLSKNIYSDKSYYLLTDSQTPVTPEANPVNGKTGATEVAYGYGMVYHEKDLRHNEYMEGQVFWGEETYKGSPAIFSINRKYCKDAPSYVWLEYANSVENGGQVEVTLNDYTTTSPIANMPANIYTLGTSSDQVRLNVNGNHAGSGELSIGVGGDYLAGALMAIDYWTLSYPISLEYAKADPDFTSQYIAFMDVSSNKWKHHVPANSVVWDITGGQDPTSLDVENGYFYHNVRYSTEIVAFNPERQQLQINPEWTGIENQNLHQLQEEPVSMVIITLPGLRTYAEKIARLHESAGESRVAVVTPEEVYNEFNHGTPDVTALRAFVKMLYQKHPDTMKHVLLFGNIYADYRNIDSHPDRPEGLPVYMIPKVNLKYSEGAEGSASPDYVGVMADYINSTGMLGNADHEVAVGLLPISSVEEAEIAVRKITNYLEKTDFSNLVNEFMTISDSGDSHIHDFQAFKLANMYNQLAASTAGSQFAVSPLWSEQMGFTKARESLLAGIRRGKLFTTYYGHAGTGGFGNVTFQDLQRLDNEEPAFMFMAACDLCEPDRLHHGIGDLGVIRNPRGLMANICGTRSVLSHENQALSENFVTSMFIDRDNNVRTSMPTLGEIYSRAKTQTKNVSKQGFMLIGDPALPVPVALGKVHIEVDRDNYRAGEIMEVTGFVADNNGDADETYNGYATIKLMEPTTEKAIVADPLDDEGNLVINPRLVINDYRLAVVKTEVKDGRFKARIPLPSKVNHFLSTPDSIRTLNLLAGTYSSNRKMAASGRIGIDMPQVGSTPAPNALKDTSAPVIDLAYDADGDMLIVTATDDSGISCDANSFGVSLKIDGLARPLNGNMSQDMASDRITLPVSTARLSAGEHTASAWAVDLSGNRSMAKTYKFTVKEKTPFKLSVDSPIAIEEVTLKARGTDITGLSYVVTDNKGNRISTGECDGNDVTLDVSEYAPGTYRAALRENSPRGARVYSNWVEFTKID